MRKKIVIAFIGSLLVLGALFFLIGCGGSSDSTSGSSGGSQTGISGSAN